MKLMVKLSKTEKSDMLYGQDYGKLATSSHTMNKFAKMFYFIPLVQVFWCQILKRLTAHDCGNHFLNSLTLINILSVSKRCLSK